MTSLTGALRAWIDIEDDKVVGAFTSNDEATRAPAKRRFHSPEEARHWVESEAAALGLPVEWVTSSA